MLKFQSRCFTEAASAEHSLEILRGLGLDEASRLLEEMRTDNIAIPGLSRVESLSEVKNQIEVRTQECVNNRRRARADKVGIAISGYAVCGLALALMVMYFIFAFSTMF